MRGADLRLNKRLHELGEQADLPYPMKSALAWWVVAELIRRHPDEVRVIETHPGGGQYDCLSLYRRNHHSSLVAHLNVVGHITHGTPDGEMQPNLGNRFNWFEVLNARNRRAYVIRQLEAVTGLPSPTSTPETTQRSIGPRFLARLAAQTAMAPRPWTILNGYEDSSQGSAIRDKLFRAFPGIPTPRMPDDVLQIPAYRFWFVVGPKKTPSAALDIDQGLLWQPPSGAAGIDLLSTYSEQGRKLDTLERRLLPPNT